MYQRKKKVESIAWITTGQVRKMIHCKLQVKLKQPFLFLTKLEEIQGFSTGLLTSQKGWEPQLRCIKIRQKQA